MRREKGTLDMKFDIVRAWKDEAYRQQLSSEEQALLPANPAGELELSEAELQAVLGAHGEVEATAVQGCNLTGEQGTCATNGNIINGDCEAEDPPTLNIVGIVSC
jgi:mersacidin/lichenicidin family type 2 lantibiotic